MIFLYNTACTKFTGTSLKLDLPTMHSERNIININNSEHESRADWTARLIRGQDGTSEQLERKRKLPVGSMGYLYHERSYSLITFHSDRLSSGMFIVQ